MPVEFSRPLLGFVAYSGTGKTTLLEQVIPELRRRGIRTALIKHAHHDFDIDTPGKDSHRLRKAGASQVMVASSKRWALINENDTQEPEPQLGALLKQLDPDRFDLLLVEGFKHEAYPKIELWRSALGKPLLCTDDAHIIALACDKVPEAKLDIPRLDMNNIDELADFIVSWKSEQPKNLR